MPVYLAVAIVEHVKDTLLEMNNPSQMHLYLSKLVSSTELPFDRLILRANEIYRQYPPHDSRIAISLDYWKVEPYPYPWLQEDIIIEGLPEKPYIAYTKLTIVVTTSKLRYMYLYLSQRLYFHFT